MRRGGGGRGVKGDDGVKAAIMFRIGRSKERRIGAVECVC